MDNFTLIHKININGDDYYLHDHIVKKFDYFKPILEYRFSGDLKVKYDHGESDLIDKFLNVIYNSRKIVLSINELNDAYNLLDFLLCNDDDLYNKFIIDVESNLSVDNLVILLQNNNLYNSRLTQNCLDKFLHFIECHEIPMESMTLLLKYGSHYFNFVLKCFDHFVDNISIGIKAFNDRAPNYNLVENVIKFLNDFDIPITENMCNQRTIYHLYSICDVKFTLKIKNLKFEYNSSNRYYYIKKLILEDELNFSKSLLKNIVWPYYFKNTKN